MPLYIKCWYSTFEYRNAKRFDRVTWRKKPVDHGSIRFRGLMSTQMGCVTYCVFEAIVDIVFRNRADGVLIDAEGRKIGPESVSVSCGIPLALCRKAFAKLKSRPVGWLSTDPEIRGVRALEARTDGARDAHDARTDGARNVRSDQIRSDRIRLDENLIRSDQAIPNGELTRPDPTGQHEDIKAAVAAIEACGLSNLDALCIAANPKADMATLRHAALKTRAELDKGRAIKNVRNYIEKCAGLRKGLAERHADRRHELRVLAEKGRKEARQ